MREQLNPDEQGEEQQIDQNRRQPLAAPVPRPGLRVATWAAIHTPMAEIR
jgi:hypothetical protein